MAGGTLQNMETCCSAMTVMFCRIKRIPLSLTLSSLNHCYKYVPSHGDNRSSVYFFSEHHFDKMVSRLLKPLKSAGVIGDVVDEFTPSVNMKVVYNTNIEVHNGFEFMPSFITSPPRVQLLNTDPATFFTLIMTDPDSPSPSNPTGREYLHWIVSDIPGTKCNYAGREIVSYESPRAMIGIHRYVFVLFEQSGKGAVDPPPSRQNFRTREFAERNGLGSPVAAVYFNARRENAARSR